MRNWTVLLMLLCTAPVFGQGDAPEYVVGQEVVVTTTGGQRFTGVLLALSPETLKLQVSFGAIDFNRSSIESVVIAAGTSVFEFENPHPTRYFFSPSGIPIARSTGYYQNLMVVGNFINLGVSKNFSIGGGFEFISTVVGEPILFLTPKAGFQVADKWHLGAGVFAATLPSETSLGVPFGVVTYGTLESNVTLGGGLGYATGEARPLSMLNLAGMHRVSTGGSLMSENYLFIPSNSDPVYLGIIGGRIMGDKNAFDFGIFTSNEFWDLELPVLPYVGYARHFGF